MASCCAGVTFRDALPAELVAGGWRWPLGGMLIYIIGVALEVGFGVMLWDTERGVDSVDTGVRLLVESTTVWEGAGRVRGRGFYACQCRPRGRTRLILLGWSRDRKQHDMARVA